MSYLNKLVTHINNVQTKKSYNFFVVSIKRVINRLAIDSKCRKCKGYHKNMEDQKEKLHYDVENDDGK